MRKRVLAWLLSGAMAFAMLPMDLSAAGMGPSAGTRAEARQEEQIAEGYGDVRSSQLPVGSQSGAGEQSLKEGLNVGEVQVPGGNADGGGGQTSGGNGTSGREQDPGGQTSGKDENPGGEAPGENKDPGGETPGENGWPGEEQMPGANEDPGEKRHPGKQDPKDSPDPSENEMPDAAAELENPFDNHPSQDSGMDIFSAQDGEQDDLMGLSGDGKDAQGQDPIKNATELLGGLELNYLEVPAEFLAGMPGIDAAGSEVLSSQAGIDWNARGSQRYSSAWDVYSSNYLYNHLSSKQKKFWDALDYICNLYLTTDLDAAMYPYNWNYACPRQTVVYRQLGMTEEMARNTFIMFAYSNPQYYFLDSASMPVNTNGVWILFFYGKFANGAARRSETSNVKSQINAMKKQVDRGKSDVEKAQIAHDLIIRNVRYEHNYQNGSPYYHQSAYSVFCQGYTVCAGYSKAFELLMNAVGIDAMAVTSASHAWNLVRLDDSWYQVDCTWDDRDGANGYEGIYLYFCRKTSRIAGDLDRNNFHQMEYFYSKKVPKCTLDSGATATSIGTYKTPSSRVKNPTISAKKVSGGMQVTIRSATSGASIYYTLDGKAPSPSAAKCYRYTKPFKVTKNVTVKAVAICDQRWDSTVRSTKVYGKVYLVKFNAMGGKKVSSKKVYSNAKVKKPSTPKRSGYKFVGWYQDKKCKKAWNFNKKITKSMTLYAKWKRK